MATDPEELAHWRAVAAKPFDEAPRWEYLKWLKLKGHNERARFTQLQLDAAFCQPWDFLALEAANFRGGYLSDWGPLPAPPEMRSGRPYEVGRWEGGFPSELTVNDFPGVIPKLPELATSAPITRIELGDLDAHAAHQIDRELEALGHSLMRQARTEHDQTAWRRFQAIFRGEPEDQDLAPLVERWERDQLGSLMRVLNGTWFSRVRHLGFAGGADVVSRVLREVKLDHLTSLAMKRWTLRSDAARLNDALLKNLQALSIGGLGYDLGQLPALRSLTLYKEIDEGAFTHLLESAPGLRRLELRFEGWGQAVARWPGLEQLEALTLLYSNAADLRAVMATNKLERLRSLRIVRLRASTTDDFAYVFASLNKLQRLSIKHTELRDQGLDVLHTSGAFPHLIALELDDCGITDDGVFRFAKTIRMPKLRWVRLAPFSLKLTEQSVFAVQQKFAPANQMAFDD